MERFFIDRIKLNKENIDNTKYPFNIKCLRDFDELKISNPVTFFMEKMELESLRSLRQLLLLWD